MSGYSLKTRHHSCFFKSNTAHHGIPRLPAALARVPDRRITYAAENPDDSLLHAHDFPGLMDPPHFHSAAHPTGRQRFLPHRGHPAVKPLRLLYAPDMHPLPVPTAANIPPLPSARCSYPGSPKGPNGVGALHSRTSTQGPTCPGLRQLRITGEMPWGTRLRAWGQSHPGVSACPCPGPSCLSLYYCGS